MLAASVSSMLFILSVPLSLCPSVSLSLCLCVSLSLSLHCLVLFQFCFCHLLSFFSTLLPPWVCVCVRVCLCVRVFSCKFNQTCQVKLVISFCREGGWRFWRFCGFSRSQQQKDTELNPFRSLQLMALPIKKGLF